MCDYLLVFRCNCISILCRFWDILLLQPSCWRHHSPQRTVSPIHRRDAAPSRHVRRQHTRRAVLSRQVYHWCQTVVTAELSTAQTGQVRSSDRRNDQSSACGDVIRVICVRGRSRPTSSRWYQSAGGRARLAPVVSQARLGGGTIVIVQLPCTGHPTRSTPADYGTGTDTGL